MIVTLTLTEWHMAVQNGMLRDWMHTITSNIVGSIGELAVAKSLGVFYSGEVNAFHESPDVPGGFDVRATTLENGSLIIRAKDKDHRAAVLAIVRAPEVDIRGWITVREAKIVGSVRNPGGWNAAWFVKQSDLADWPPSQQHQKQRALL